MSQWTVNKFWGAPLPLWELVLRVHLEWLRSAPTCGCILGKGTRKRPLIRAGKVLENAACRGGGRKKLGFHYRS